MTKILGISGSLRTGSVNSKLIREAARLYGETEFEEADLNLPLYNGDDEDRDGLPASVQTLVEQIAAADGIVISTPEYNAAIPGVLKNAIDWLSRIEDQPFNGKPIAIMGASKGALGTARSQYHLRQVFIFLNGLVMNRPEVFVGSAHNKFDDQGKLTDKDTRDFLKTYCEALLDWVKKVDG